MTIYTGRGDAGETDLRDRTRVPKTDPRIEAYGTVDEANALIGTVRPTGHEDIDELLATVQNHLHVVQADLADPAVGDAADDAGATDTGTGDADATDADTDDADATDAAPTSEAPRVRPAHVETLEARIDGFDDELEPLRSFVLPGGGEAGAALHHARAVVRRAERRTVALARTEAINGNVVTYLNRLSDLLFTLGRVANARDGEREESPTY